MCKQNVVICSGESFPISPNSFVCQDAISSVGNANFIDSGEYEFSFSLIDICDIPSLLQPEAEGEITVVSNEEVFRFVNVHYKGFYGTPLTPIYHGTRVAN